MTNTTIPNVVYPVANAGVSTSVFVDVFNIRDPTTSDVQYPVQKKWFNTVTDAFWILTGFTTTNGIITANWEKISAGSIMETLTGNTGAAVPPSGNNINVVGDGTYISVAGNPGTSTLTISPTGALTTLYTAQSGTATPMAGNLNVFGSGLITTTASGNTITINSSGALPWLTINSSITLATNTGYFCIGGGALSLALPASSVLGDTIDIALDGSTSFTITQAAGQQIRVSGSESTVGATGTVSTTGSGDSISMVCRTANDKWVAISYNGNLTVT